MKNTRRYAVTALELMGVGAVVVGLWYIWWPVAVIVAGLIAVIIAMGLE